MAAIAFPSTPSLNDIHTVGARSWKYNGTAWKLVPRTTDAVLEGSTNLYYTDARVAAAPAVSALEGRASAIEADITAIESDISTITGSATSLTGRVDTLESGLATEKGRVDAILSAADADKDSFAEIVSLINSVDTANDSAFAGYVTSNDAAVAALDGRLDTAESDITALETRAGTIESAATTLTGRVDTAESDITAIETAASTLSGRVDTAESDITAIETAASTLAGRVDTAESDIDTLQSDLDTAESSLSSHIADTENPHSVTAAQVGLGNVSNTSDADKPVSTATQTALDGKQIKDVVSTTAPSHTAGLRWIDPTDMSEYLSYNGAWVEIDKQ